MSSIAAIAETLNHTADWHAERATGIGASDASKVMEGGEAAVRLWEEKTGRREPDDLSDVLPVQLGSFTEPFNLYWFAKQTGFPVEIEKERRSHADRPWMQCEIDGLTGDRLVECKHVSAFAKEDEILGRYYWQCQHQLAVTGMSICYLSVLFGTFKYEWYSIERDEEAIAELIEKEAEFWRCVQEDDAPHLDVSAAVSVSLDDMRDADMTGHNEWADLATDWLDNKDAKTKFDKADKGLKGLVESDVKLAFGHGVQVKRAKNGSLRIGAEK